jgi:2-methylcitrate dehydratase PrpD
MDKLWGAVHAAMAEKSGHRQPRQRRLRDRGEQARGVPAGDRARLRQVRQAVRSVQNGRTERGHGRIEIHHGAGAIRGELDAARLPADVRQKLGWLLLDHLRVCSIGARLPWSDWSRRYVGLVGKAGTSHVLFSPDTVNPQHATFLNVTFGSSFDADDTHVGAMLHPGVAAWSAALAVAEHTGASGPEVLARSSPAMKPRSVSGSRCSRAISSAASRAPAPATGSAPAAAAGRLLFRGQDAARKIADALGLGRRLRQRPGAVLLFRRIGQAHPRGARRRGRRRRGAARGGGLRGPNDIIEGQGGFARAYADAWNPALIEDGLGQRFHLMDVLVKSHAAAARVAAGIDAMLELRQQHTFAIGDIASMALGIPKIIQGRLTNPHPVDLQAAQMCLPFSVALAAKIALAPGGIRLSELTTSKRVSRTKACMRSRNAQRLRWTTRWRRRATSCPPRRESP